MPKAPLIAWLRRDLRISDNPALYHASKQGCPVIPVFIWAPHEDGVWAPGGAHKWWLHHSLTRLKGAFGERYVDLIIRQGHSLETLEQIIEETGAGAVYWNTRYEPEGRRVDAAVTQMLGSKGIATHMFAGHLLHQPDEIKTGSGNPYKVFTPFWKKFNASLEVPRSLPAPEVIRPFTGTTRLQSLDIDQLDLLPKTDWAAGFSPIWTPGEKDAHQRLDFFIDSIMGDYPVQRDFPSDEGTSRLSPHLHFGEISPRQIWNAVISKSSALNLEEAGVSYLRQIAWREFSYHLLYHFPETPLANMKPAFDKFEWNKNDAWLKKWQRGETGYPIVDAGMRELWTTGWMHNRVRMIVASFLTKHLLISWQEGAKWFWDTLVDGNLANNTMGWQWSAGSGADAQPFFRIFNPITQGQRFDASGAYIKKWVPELSNLPQKYIHEPWTLPENLQHQAGFIPGTTYPLPVVDHKVAREQALRTYQKIR